MDRTVSSKLEENLNQNQRENNRNKKEIVQPKKINKHMASDNKRSWSPHGNFGV